METINDIVADIRAQNQGLPEDGYALSPLVCDLLSLADSIEAAMKAECEELHKRIKLWSDRADELRKKCDEQYAVIKQDLTTEKTSAVGNAAKIREALETISKCDISKEEDCYTLYRVCEEALAAPPRNVDRFNVPDEALSAYCENKGITHPLPLWFGNEFWALLNWLFAEAKGK